MEILRAIERADALCPNSYTLEEKLCWCDEVTAELRRNIIKVYDMIETRIGGFGEVQLPDEIPFERVEVAFVDGKRLDKQDFRSFVAGAPMPADIMSGRSLRVVYLTLPEAIRRPDIRGEFNTGENYIEIEASPFAEGDKIELVHLEELSDKVDYAKAEAAFVMEVQPDKIILDRDVLIPQTAACLAIRRVIDDITAIDEAPYDGMYIEYILAKMAYYQHDYVGYNAHMAQYSTLFEQMRREYKTRNPLTSQSKFKNYSIL